MTDNDTIIGISSMATRQLLAELAARYQQRHGVEARFESVGGVDAARRVQAGETFDLVVLAADALDKLVAAGAVRAGSRRDLARSPVAVAVRADAARPDISTEAALRAALLAAGKIGYSTGPSGTALLGLLARWGIADTLAARLMQAPPGVPVGKLLAEGAVDIGFQQRSELLHLPGIDILGSMPPACEIVTTFSAGVCASAPQAEAAARLIDFLCGAEAAGIIRQQGMTPAS